MRNYFCFRVVTGYLNKIMDRGAWWDIVHRVAKSWTQLKQLSRNTHTQSYQKETEPPRKFDTLNCLIVLLFAIDIASIFFWSIWGYIACIICVLFSLFYTKHRLLYILFCIWHFSLQLFHISSWRSSWVFFSFLFLFFFTAVSLP